MNADCRISTTALNHPKIVKLKRRLGAEGVLSLLTLWAWTASERPNGALDGLDEEDLAIVAGWPGDEGFFITTLIELRLLDWDGERFIVRDLEEQNQRATRDEERGERARNAAQKRWEKGKSVASMLSVNPMRRSMIEHPCRIDEHSRTVQYCSSTCSTTTTPNPSSSEERPEATPTDESVVVCGGGDEGTENRESVQSVAALEYPASLSDDEQKRARPLVEPYPELAQALLDELAAAMRAGRIKTSPIAYLRALVKRANAGEFNPEAGVKIARDRERRRAAETAVREALSRPPAQVAPSAGRSQVGPKPVSEHIAALKAALGMRAAGTTAADHQAERIAA